MDQTEPIDESYSKPGFDGRLHYYKLVGNYMINIAITQNMHDYHGWLDNINGLFDMVSPFIKQPADIRLKILRCGKHINSLSNCCLIKSNQVVLNKHIETELHDLTQTIYKSAKHMLLPISEDSNNEFDEDDFFEGSDL